MIVGEWFEWEYPNHSPFIDVSAVVFDIQNETLILTGFSIFTNYGHAASVGTALMKKMTRQFLVDLKSQGFSSVVIHGERLSGMAKGRKFKLTYDF